jgi:hypothetical protein
MSIISLVAGARFETISCQPKIGRGSVSELFRRNGRMVGASGVLQLVAPQRANYLPLILQPGIRLASG